jgi:hypothetical protein
MADAAATDRSITVERDAVNSVITSGDGNTITIIYQMVAAAAQLASGKNPYLGLLAFTEADADRFFGRDRGPSRASGGAPSVLTGGAS